MQLTHNYEHEYEQLIAQGVDWVDCANKLTKQFERDAKEYLRGLRRKDVGAVFLYLDKEGLEEAYFDYENMWGNVRALNGFRSDGS
jgi:hypothetical protein